MIKNLRLLVLGLSFSSGCVQKNSDARLQMTNPEALNTQKYPWAGRLIVAPRGDIQGTSCTATLLMPNVAITARHCVNFFQERDRKPEEVTFELPGQGTSKVKSWTSKSRNLDEEITILFLEKPFAVTQFPKIAASPLPANETVRFIGFGQISYTGPQAGKLVLGDGQFGTMKFVGYDKDSYKIPTLSGVDVVNRTSKFAMAKLVQVTDGGNTACPGDSGGPLFVESAAGAMLHGVASHVTSIVAEKDGVKQVTTKCDPLNSVSYVALNEHQEWIKKILDEEIAKNGGSSGNSEPLCADTDELAQIYVASSPLPVTSSLSWKVTPPQLEAPNRKNNFRINACANWASNSFKLRDLVTLASDGKALVSWQPVKNYDQEVKTLASGQIANFEMRFTNQASEEFVVIGVNGGNFQYLAGSKTRNGTFIDNKVVLGNVEWGNPFGDGFCEEGGRFTKTSFLAESFLVSSEVCRFQAAGNSNGFRLQKVEITKNDKIVATYSKESIHLLEFMAAAPLDSKGIWYRYSHHNEKDYVLIRSDDFSMEINANIGQWDLKFTDASGSKVSKHNTGHPFLAEILQSKEL